MKPTAVIFDAYGTLFDIHAPIARTAQHLGDTADVLSARWRAKQLQYTWLRALMGAYADFWQVTGEALDHTMAELNIGEPDLRDQLLALYRTVDAYPDAQPLLERIAKAGVPAAILSNGEPAMIKEAVDANGLSLVIDTILSVNEIQTYKPARAVYQLVLDRYGGTAPNIVFVSANGWDAAGAAHFGFSTIWINRDDTPQERLPATPAITVASLAEVGDHIAGIGD